MAPLTTTLTFALVTFGWLLFRERDIAFIGSYLAQSPFSQSAEDFRIALFLLARVAIYGSPLWIYPAYEWAIKTKLSERVGLITHRRAFDAVAASGMFMAVLALRPEVSVEFIYFQF